MCTDKKNPTESGNHLPDQANRIAKHGDSHTTMSVPHEKLQALEAIRALHPGVSCAAQRDRIRAALALFPVTTFEAIRYLDCYDPRPRVLELRQQGEAIETHRQIIQTESGERHRVGLYVLRPGVGKEGTA